ncbi:MAG: DUF72 domain-containing protein [Bacteroidota bacterium]
MKFGKVAAPETIDFTISTRPAEVPTENQTTGLAPIYIGATGWSMKQWVGKWYPPGTKATDFLEEYGRLFNTIELNTTHYRIPTFEQVEKWCDQVPEDFRFCPKIPQRISHAKDLGLGSGLIGQTSEAFDRFGHKLGCCFVQLPPYFGYDRLNLLELFLEAWPKSLPIAVEFRHESWFTSPERIDQWIEVLKAHGATAVITDVAGRRDVMHMQLSSARTMVRWVGNGLIESDYERLADWVEIFRQWKLMETYIFPHQPDNLLAPEAAYWLAERLQATDWANTRGPKPYEEPPPDQLALF